MSPSVFRIVFYNFAMLYDIANFRGSDHAVGSGHLTKCMR